MKDYLGSIKHHKEYWTERGGDFEWSWAPVTQGVFCFTFLALMPEVKDSQQKLNRLPC